MASEIWSRGQTDPLLIADSILFSRLADTIAWCRDILADANIDASLRSRELTPRMLHDGRDDVVCDVGSSRHWRIRVTTDSPVTSFPDLLGGRLLAYFPDADLCDGAAEVESDGFFDVYNVPPWDTWVGYFEDNPEPSGSYDSYLLAYVPEQLLSLVSRGILVNPEECILWLSDTDVKLRTRLSNILYD